MHSCKTPCFALSGSSADRQVLPNTCIKPVGPNNVASCLSLWNYVLALCLPQLPDGVLTWQGPGTSLVGYSDIYWSQLCQGSAKMDVNKAWVPYGFRGICLGVWNNHAQNDKIISLAPYKISRETWPGCAVAISEAVTWIQGWFAEVWWCTEK